MLQFASVPASIVLLNTHAASDMACALTGAGFDVWEALSVSEVLYLCEHHTIDLVVIAAGVEDPEMIALQMGRTTVQLNNNATAEDVLWELSQLLPAKKAASIQ